MSLKKLSCYLFETFKRWKDVKILKNDLGKPYIENSDIEISISHSDSFIFVGIGDLGMMLGIDCEITNKKSLKNIDGIFLREWIIKKAFLKMIGTGFSFGIESINVDFNKNTIKLDGLLTKNIDISSEVFYKIFIVEDTLFSICCMEK